MGGPPLIDLSSKSLCGNELARCQKLDKCMSFQILCAARLYVHLVKSYASEGVRFLDPDCDFFDRFSRLGAAGEPKLTFFGPWVRADARC